MVKILITIIIKLFIINYYKHSDFNPHKSQNPNKNVVTIYYLFKKYCIY